MSKATDAVIAALKAKFETGDVPDGTDFAQLVQIVQDAVQEHEHASGGGAGAGTGDAGQVAYPGDLKDLFFDWPLSPMLVDGGVIENGTNANTIKHSALTAILRKTTDADGVLVKVTKAAEDNIAITNPDISYYVVLQYSGGTPAIALQAAKPNQTTDIVIGKCIRNGDGLRHVINSGMRLANGLAKLHRRAATLRELELESGCAIAHTGTRNFTIGAGVVYGGINRFEPFDSGDFTSLTDKFTLIYNNGSWQYVADQTAIPNDKYNDYGVGLVNLGNNKHGCWWIYIHPGDEHVYAVYGTDTYSFAEALLENPPEHLPTLLNDYGTLIGCVIVKEGEAVFAAIQQVTAQYFGGAGAADHGGLAGLSDDDHPQYMVKDTPQLGGDLDLNGHVILGQITGFEWNQGADTWARIDKNGDTLSLNQSDFDKFWPWAGMRRVNLAVNGEINAIYGDDNYREDGANGRVMVEIPKFWVRSEAEGHRVTIIVNNYSVGGTDTITITPIGQSPTVWTEGTDFNAATSNDVTATNIAAAIDAIANYTASASGRTVTVNYDSGKAIESCASNDTAAWSAGITHIKYRRWIADHAASGFEVNPAFNQRVTSKPAPFVRVGAYEATLMDDAGTLKLDSKSGEQPWTGGEFDSLAFNSGSVVFVIGETLTGAIGGATGQVLDWHVVTGSWGGGNAAGTVYLKQVSATPFQAEDLNGSTGGANIASATGANAALGLTINNARTYGTNVGSGWGIVNIHTREMLKLLHSIEYGNMDSQTNIGRGIVDKAGGSGFAGEETAASSINSNLGTNGTGAGTGVNGVVPIAYRWLENLWGNVWEFVDGYEAVDAAYHILKATGGWTNSGPSVWGSGDYDASTAAPITADGYISNIVYEEVLKYLLIPSAIAGSSSTYIPDHFWAHDAGETNILLAGGCWDAGSSAGLGYLTSDLVASGSSRLIGCRLEFIG